MEKKVRKYDTESCIEAANEVYNRHYMYDRFVFAGRNVKSCITCPVHGDFWQTPAAHLQGQGCPECGRMKISEKRKNKSEEVLRRCAEADGGLYSLEKAVYRGMNTKMCFICKKHGEFWQTPSNHISGSGCPKCAGFNLTREEVIERFREVHGEKYDYTESHFTKLGDEMEVVCPKHGSFTTTPSKHLDGRGCPKCALDKASEINKVTEEEFIERGNLIHDGKYIYDDLQLVNMSLPVHIKCPEHGYFWQMANEHLRGRGCPVCGKHVSYAEDEILSFVQGLIGMDKVEKRNRTILDGKELDIFIPEYKIAREYNGNYWHSEEKGRDRKYHLSKMEVCNEKGVRLVQIFEDEWKYRKNIVLSKIKHILNKDSDLKSVYARNTEVRAISKEDAKEFLEANHIQGNGQSSIELGCFYKEALCGVMTFKKIRDSEWELNRFATDITMRCVGIGGKLFKHFIRQYKPSLVRSFADRRWTLDSTNNLYTALGFSFEKTTGPDYRYVTPGSVKRVHKFNMRKNTLSKKYGLPLSMTEKEMCDALHFYRIWDCGLYSFVWKNTEWA